MPAAAVPRDQQQSMTAGRLALAPAEAAAALGVSVAQVRRWCARWRSTHGRDGLRHSRPAPRLILIRPSDIETMLQQHDGGAGHG